MPDPKGIKSVKLFYSYSHKDEEYRETLETFLATLKRQGYISEWHDRKLVAGEEWDREIKEHLESAGIILLLVSADFIASDYIWDVEVGEALALHEAGKTRVIPVILRVCDWNGTPFGKLEALPKDAKPIKTWPDRDEAFTDVARGIRRAVKELNCAGSQQEERPTGEPQPSGPVLEIPAKTDSSKEQPEEGRPAVGETESAANVTRGPEVRVTKAEQVEQTLQRVKVLESEVAALRLDFNGPAIPAMQRGELTVWAEGETLKYAATGEAASTDWNQLYAEAAAAVEGKATEALALLEEAKRLDPLNIEVLLHEGAALSSFRSSKRLKQARDVLLKVVTLLGRPKNDVEKYQLAQARLGLAPQLDNTTASAAQLQLARKAFAELGEDGMVQACDEALVLVQQISSPGPQPTRPSPPTEFKPVGHWLFSENMRGPVTWWDLVINPGGTCAMRTGGMKGSFNGSWSFDSRGPTLLVDLGWYVKGTDGQLRRTSFRIRLQERQNGRWIGTDDEGASFVLAPAP